MRMLSLWSVETAHLARLCASQLALQWTLQNDQTGMEFRCWRASEMNSSNCHLIGRSWFRKVETTTCELPSKMILLRPSVIACLMASNATLASPTQGSPGGSFSVHAKRCFPKESWQAADPKKVLWTTTSKLILKQFYGEGDRFSIFNLLLGIEL